MSQEITSLPELLTRKDLVQLFKVTLSTVIRWEAEKKFPCLHLGTRVRYQRTDIEKFIAASGV